jgi:Holliday junction resolvase RusA-like endonuclease
VQIFSLDIPGSVRGKGRPRFRVIGKGKRQFVSTYTDAETRKYEERLRLIASERMGITEPFDCPLSVKIEAFTDIPSSWSGKKRIAANAGDIMPVSKPDLDNICKAVLDSFNEVVWTDDSRVVAMTLIKRYSLTPMLRIGVWKWFD